MMHVPMVLEGRPGHERAWDLYSRLNKDRIIILGEAINDSVANIIVAQLLFMESEDRTSDIYMYINSPGGTISSGMAIYDTMMHVGPDVNTICVGSAASMGAILLSAGTKGKRYILPNAEVMIHQPLGGAQGQASDIEITANRIVKLKNKLAKILADNCGKNVKSVLKDMDRDYWLDAEDAVKYGIVDKIMTKEGDKDGKKKDTELDLL